MCHCVCRSVEWGQPLVAVSTVCGRGRVLCFRTLFVQECESDVPLDYLSKLHEEYLKFIDDMK